MAHHANHNGVATDTTATATTSTKVLVPPPTTTPTTTLQPHFVSSNHVPRLCQYWCYISNEIIPKYVPFHLRIYHLDVTLTIVSALVLSILRYVAEYSMVSIFHWPHNAYITKNAAASVAAIFHSIQLVPSLYVCFRSLSSLSSTSSSQPNNGQRSSSSSRTDSNKYNPSQHMMVVSDTWWKDTVDALLQFCTGYMMYDGVLNIIYMKLNIIGHITMEDYLFLGHHLATILYMSSVRYIQQGHQSAMICMLLGEMTNPFHNMYYIASAAQTLSCCNGTLSTFLFHYITLAFAVSYVFVRTVVGPFVFVHLTYNLWTTGRRKDVYPIPIALLVMWTILIWGVILGSIPWIVECYHMIQTYIMDPTPLFQSTTAPPQELLKSITNDITLDINTEL
jgi:TLC domain